MSMGKQVLLISQASAPAMPALADALRAAGAQVREMNMDDCGALLDALEQGWMPVVLKAPSA
jgi:DNA-binding transcriptional MocR family regulator